MAANSSSCLNRASTSRSRGRPAFGCCCCPSQARPISPVHFVGINIHIASHWHEPWRDVEAEASEVDTVVIVNAFLLGYPAAPLLLVGLGARYGFTDVFPDSPGVGPVPLVLFIDGR